MAMESSGIRPGPHAANPINKPKRQGYSHCTRKSAWIADFQEHSNLFKGWTLGSGTTELDATDIFQTDEPNEK
jgi:hypothetical protein